MRMFEQNNHCHNSLHAHLEYLETLSFNERTFEAEMASSPAFEEAVAQRDIQAFHSPASQLLYADVTKMRVWQLRKNSK